jgi:ABC-2 type transport system ATP-binding protein/lipopolysaccharide transport system ATP-binding protein
MANVIECQGVSKRYLIGEHHGSDRNLRETIMGQFSRRHAETRREIWSLRDVTFEVGAGEAVGVIGRNGSGKSTLLKILSRITEPTEGRIRTRGQVGSLLEVGTGFHPELTGRENVRLNGAVLGMRRREVMRKFDEIVEFSGIGDFIDTPVKRYSSGMYLRLAFSVAAHLEADIMLVDEVLAVGDAEFQRKCLGKMSEVEREGRTVVFVSHNLDAVIRLCSRAMWIDGGAVRAAGPTAEVVQAYVGEGMDASGMRRWSTDEAAEDVRLVSLSVLAEDEKPTGVLNADKGFAVAVEFVVDRPTPGLDVAVTLSTTRGTRILNAALSDDSIVLTGAGRRHAVLRVPPLLVAGDYSVGVWIGSPYEDFAWEEDALTFRLEGPTNGRPDRLIDLSQVWTVGI